MARRCALWCLAPSVYQCCVAAAPARGSFPKADAGKHGHALAAAAAATAARRNFVARCVDNTWAAARAAMLVWRSVLPLMWACVLHFLSDRLVSRRALHDLALGFFKHSGPCFMKLGQWAASRRDIFSDEFCDLVGQLHSECPSHAWRDTHKRLVAAYGDDYTATVFDSVDETALHSGCIAQIHRARVKGDDRPMVVKVLHPDIEWSIGIDLTILSWGVHALTALVPGSEWVSLREAFYEFEAHMKQQVDLRIEADNLNTFHAKFADVPNITFPTPVLPLSHPSVLVETFEEGAPVSEYLVQQTCEKSRRRVAMQGCQAFFKMIFDDNFFHTDLHPGNILVQDDGAESKLVIVDAGLVATLSDVDRKNFIELFAAVCAGDGRLAADLILDGAKHQRCEDRERFRTEMARIIDKVSVNRRKSFRLSDVDIGEILLDALSVARTNRVKLDPDFTNVVVSIVLLEGIGRALYPDLNLFNVSIPYLLPKISAGDVRQLVPIIKAQYF